MNESPTHFFPFSLSLSLFHLIFRAVAIDYARANLGARRFQAVGFCWGGLMAARAAGEAACPFERCGSVHGAKLQAEHAEKATVPLMLVPAENDPPVDSLVEILEKKSFARECAWFHVQGAPHGFMGARGDWGNEGHAQQRAKVLEMCRDFFK